MTYTGQKDATVYTDKRLNSISDQIRYCSCRMYMGTGVVQVVDEMFPKEVVVP